MKKRNVGFPSYYGYNEEDEDSMNMFRKAKDKCAANCKGVQYGNKPRCIADCMELEKLAKSNGTQHGCMDECMGAKPEIDFGKLKGIVEGIMKKIMEKKMQECQTKCPDGSQSCMGECMGKKPGFDSDDLAQGE